VTTPHLLVDISAHGLGHLAQTAPVLAALRRELPELTLTIRSGHSRARLMHRIAEPFTHLDVASDFGFVMHNAIDIDYAASAERYRQFHADWPRRVAEEADVLQQTGAQLVLANAAYLPLASATLAGMPSIGMCSLNWADLFGHYFGTQEWAIPIHRQILAAYNSADVFLCLAPGMPMLDFANRREIGPIGGLTTSPRQRLRIDLATALGLDENARWVLIAMGGMEFRLPIEGWPQIPGLQWLCAHSWAVQRDDVRAFDSPGNELAFTDILAASDAVLTKPGYGTFVEAACNGVPVLYVPRDDWPEEAFLAQWLNQYGRCATVSRDALQAGNLLTALNSLWQQPPRDLPYPTGISLAVKLLRETLSAKSA
jgi:hypothetical protein